MARRHSRPEPGGRTPLVTRIPQSLKKRLQLYCTERGIERQRVVEEAIREWLAGGELIAGGLLAR